MKAHTSDFKNTIKEYGREIDSKITYMQNGDIVELGNDELNSVTPHYEGSILKSVMKQLDIEADREIPIGTIVHYDFGVKVGETYDYITFGNYYVKEVEKKEDTNSYLIKCYDAMLFSMVDYEDLGITYPITIRSYINTICQHLGITFKNINDNFANYNKQIPNELYLDDEGNSLGYTFRDVLDELAEVTASTICINEDDNELEIRYITNTGDTIDEEYLKNVNVNFGEKYGAINTIVFTRGGGADSIHYPVILPENPIEIKIEDNQILNSNDRADYMLDIYNKLNGLEFYLNDFSSTGIGYYNLCDRYSVTIGGSTYSCVMLNDEFLVTQGLEENIYTDIPQIAETDYKYTDSTDKRINQTTLIVNKQNQTIEALVEQVQPIQGEKAGNGSITLENAYEGTLHYLSITGEISVLFPRSDLYPNTDLYPIGMVLIVDENRYQLPFTYLRYISNEICDKYIYEDGKQKIERHVGVDNQGNYYPLIEPIIEEKDELIIEVESNSILYMESFANAKLHSIYLLKNDYTDTFAPTVDIISKINLSPGNAQIQAKNIKLEGYTTINGNFGVDLQGNMFANNGSFSGNVYLQDGNKVIGGKGIFTNMQFMGKAYGMSMSNTLTDPAGGFFLGFNGELTGQNTYTYFKSYHCCQVYIPEGFSVEKAYITILHEPITYTDGNTSGTGYVRNLKAYNITNEFGGNAVLTNYEYYFSGSPTLDSSTEIISAFGNNGHTFSNDFVETYTSGDISNIFTGEGNYSIAIASANAVPSSTSTKNITKFGPYTGFVTMFVNIIGYMTTNIEEEEE